jgi:hypothetical protein
MNEYRTNLLKEIGIDANFALSDLRAWIVISKKNKLSEEFIREFQNLVDWSEISRYQLLSEDFIREFQNRVSWNFISAKQKLSDAFLIEFKDKIIWSWYFSYQSPSATILKKFVFKVNIINLDRIHTVNLNALEIKEIQKLLDVKNAFTNKETI